MLRIEPQIIAAYVATGKVKLAFSPVLDRTPSDMLMHQAAECAGQQRPLALWQMRTMIFGRQDLLWNVPPESAVQLSQEIGLDAGAFQACLSEPTVTDKLYRLDEQRKQAGIYSRPQFNINGRMLQGLLEFEQFVQIIEAALNR